MYFSPDAQQYLKSYFPDLVLYSDQNLLADLQTEYQSGTRRFILNLLSSQIMNIMDWIQSTPDATYISPTSTVSTLRDTAKNLYFTSSSDTYYQYYLSTQFAVNITALVYDHPEDIFVQQTIQTFQKQGFLTADVNSSDWLTFQNLILVSIDSQIYTQVNDKIRSSSMTYTLNGIDIEPPTNIQVSPNVINLVFFSPKTTLYPQTNSYWNVISKEPDFTYASPYVGVLPVLIHTPLKKLKKLQIISTSLQNNGFLPSVYLPLNPVPIPYTLHNPNFIKPDHQLVWLINRQQKVPYKEANVRLTQDLNPKICHVRWTNNFCKWVLKYYRQGYRTFILDGPTDFIIPVQNLYLCNARFLCPRATSPTIRRSGSPFAFTLLNDTEMIQIRILGGAKFVLSKFAFIVSPNGNINLPSFIKTLQEVSISYYYPDQVSQIPRDTITIVIVGTDQVYNDVLNYIIQHISEFPSLVRFQRYGDYITANQYNILTQHKLLGEVCLINFNSGQIFLDSIYSQVSRPLYLPGQVNFLNLDQLIFSLPVSFLFHFGFITDL